MASKVLAGKPAITFAPGRRNLSALHARVLLKATFARIDTQFGGPYKVQGTVAVAGTPDVMVARLVVLFDEHTKRPIRSQISTAQGAYNFVGVSIGPWSIVAYDHTGEFNAVIASGKFGERM